MARESSLAPMLEAVTKWAKERKLPVSFSTMDGESGFPRVSFEDDPNEEASIKAYLGALESLDPVIILIDAPILEEDDLAEAIERANEDDTDPELLRELKALRQHVGAPGRVVVECIVRSPGFVLAFERYAEWHDLVFDEYGEEEYEDEPMDAETKAFYEARDRELELWAGPKRKTTVDALLADPRFPKAKTATSRVMLLKELLGEDAPQDARIVEQVAREARAAWELRSGR